MTLNAIVGPNPTRAFRRVGVSNNLISCLIENLKQIIIVMRKLI